MSKPHHLPCGCRPRSVQTRGHRPGCLEFDLERFKGQRRVRAFRRNWTERGATDLHARGVILSV